LTVNRSIIAATGNLTKAALAGYHLREAFDHA
jgi:hypothetical protein